MTHIVWKITLSRTRWLKVCGTVFNKSNCVNYAQKWSRRLQVHLYKIMLFLRRCGTCDTCLVLTSLTNCLPVTIVGVSSAPLVLVTPATLATPWSSPDRLSTLERRLSLLLTRIWCQKIVWRRPYHLLLDSFHTRQMGSRLSWPEVRELTLDLRDTLRDRSRDMWQAPPDGVSMADWGATEASWKVKNLVLCKVKLKTLPVSYLQKCPLKRISIEFGFKC